jgi:hypothetical protein
MRRVKELLGLVCAVQFMIIGFLLTHHFSDNASQHEHHQVPNRLPMLDVGKVLALHQDQKKQIEDTVNFNRQTSSILMQSCLKSRERDRRLLDELLRDNQNLREGKVMPALRAFKMQRTTTTTAMSTTSNRKVPEKGKG